MKTGLKISGIILIFVLFTFGCSEKNRPAERTLRFWHFWSEPNQTKALKELISEFEIKFNCRVETTELSWNDGKTKLLAAFNSGTPPDVLELGSDWVAQFSSSGVLQELNKDSAGLNKFIEFSLPPCYWQGKVYTVPWVVDTRVMYYNTDLMKKSGLPASPPKNIQELIQFSEKISLSEGFYGFGANGSDPHRLYKKILPFIWSYGGDIFDSNLQPVINSGRNVEAFNSYIQLSRVGLIETQRQIDAAFVQGKVGFWFSGAWLLDKLGKENPNLNFGVALIPGRTSEPGISFAGGEYLAVSSKSNNKGLSVDLIKFLSDGMNSIKFCKQVSEAGFPADKKYYNDPYYKTQKYRSVFAEQLKYSRMTPVHPHWLDIESAIENSLVEVMYGQKGSQEALNEAQQLAIRAGGK